MDLSSLPEAQKQQLQQLQQQFHEHQVHQQEQQQAQQQQQQQYNQDYASQPYDPSQVQSYDQSYYSYHHYQQNPQHSQPQYDYNQTSYTNAYHQQSQQSQQQYSQPESVGLLNPPGISEAPLPVVESGSVGLGQGQIQVEHQQNAYYPQHVGPGVDQSNLGFPGLNPAAAAAVAALSQLTQFAGTMGVAERAIVELQKYGPMMGHGSGGVPGPFMGPGTMHYGGQPVDRSPYRGGGRRGGVPFRGGRRNFGNRPPRTGGSGPPFRGRGRGSGRGDPRGYAPHGASSSSHPEPSAAEEAKSIEEGAEPSADNYDKAAQAEMPYQTSVPAQGNTGPTQKPIRVAWCELCRVDCTSMEILEQHKNGKKHKKNLQRLGGLKSACEPVAEIQSEGIVFAGSNPEGTLQPENADEGEEKKQTLPKNFPTEAATDENKVETEQKHNQVGQPQNPREEQSNMQATKPWINRFDNQRPGMKRKMRGGRGGKRMKIFDATGRPMEPPRPKVVIPLICDLCNVKCDTQEVFDRHLSGKKHISKLKRFEGHQAMYGPLGLQALYPPNPIAQTLYQPQDPHQAFYAPQGSYPPPGANMPPQVHHAAPVIDSGFQQNSNPQVSHGNSEFGGLKTLHGAQQQSTSVEPEAKQVVTEQIYSGSGVVGSEMIG